MGKIIYFTGGARSGKSSEAEKYINIRDYDDKIYLATSIPFDDEMKDRIKKHQIQRGENWLTIEEYKDLTEKIEPRLAVQGVILLDCVTNLVSNQMITSKITDWDNVSMEEINKLEDNILQDLKSFYEMIQNSRYDCVVVSNELGMGVVPAYALGRHFRDIAGRANQLTAKYASEAYLLVSGIQVKIK